jgi:Hint module
MDALAVGDRVLVAPGVYSTVYLFTHRVRGGGGGAQAFLRLRTLAGPAVSLTPGHYLPVAGRGLVAAAAVRVGDGLLLGSGEVSAVVAVERRGGDGLYNPQTLHGDILVDGVVSSTYTTAMEPRVAHAALVALRIVYRIIGVALEGVDSGSPFRVPTIVGGASAVL